MSRNFDEGAFNELVKKALIDIDEMSKPVIQFCGPISTGGFGSVEENITALNQTIISSQNYGIPVFNQLKYEPAFNSILSEFEDEYDFPVLKKFYEPIFCSGKIHALFFLPLWETSYGSLWEYNFAQSLGLHIEKIETLLINEILEKYRALVNKVPDRRVE